MRNGEPIHFCSGSWMHRDEDCQCPCSFCHIYSDTNPQQSDEAALIDGADVAFSSQDGGATSVAVGGLAVSGGQPPERSDGGE